jgi:hypothetical protein
MCQLSMGHQLGQRTMIIPSWDPCEVLVSKKQIVIGAILADPSPVVCDKY